MPDCYYLCVLAVFICSFLLLAPLFGYLGDRYNRKYIMIVGLIMWTLTSFCCSFVTESVREEHTVVVLRLYFSEYIRCYSFRANA